MKSSFMYARALGACITVSHAFAAVEFNVSGQAVTTRYWDCCKPSCAWKAKADVTNPVQACSADGSAADVGAGTGCQGGTAWQCAGQQPWAVNDTFAYGFAGAYLLPSLIGSKLEAAWCCACYRLDFTSDPLRGKSMIIQASNTAYDITSANRFTLAIPGGNTTSEDGCGNLYRVQQSVFGKTNSGLSSKQDCQNLPEPLRAGCLWRFDWLQDTAFPTANFQRVVCPAELTNKTQCVRKDDEKLVTTQSKSTATGTLPNRFASALAVLASLFVI